MASESIRIPFVLLAHEPRCNYEYIGYFDSFKKPTEPISSLEGDVLDHLLEEYRDFESNAAVRIEFFKLFEETRGKIADLKTKFKSIVNYVSVQTVAGSCNPHEAFDRYRLGVENDDEGFDKVVRLVVIANFRSIAEESTLDREKVIDMAKRRPSPSIGAKNENFILSQTPERLDAAYNSRPLSLAPTPISIYEPAFARFMEKLARPAESFNLKSVELRKAFQLIGVSSDYYDDEASLQCNLERLDLLEVGTFWSTTNVTIQDSPIHLDGCAVVDTHPWFPHPIFLDINELGDCMDDGDCDPSIQAGEDYIKVVSSDDYEDLRWVSCCPAILVGQTENVLIIWGAVFADRFFFEQLAHVYLGPRACGGKFGRSGLEEGILQVAKVLRILAEGLDDLRRHYNSLECPPAARSTSSRLHFCASRNANKLRHLNLGPAPGQNPRWNTFESNFSGDSKTYTIKYQRRLSSFFNKGVFLATMTATDSNEVYQVVVKFAHKYSEDGHRLLADEGLAPKLYYARYEGAESNGPGLWVVVMEYIEGNEGGLDTATEEQREKLEKAVSVLHGQGFVFGDLRYPNILVRGRSEFYLIDFDWCGRATDVVKYPLDILMDSEMGWHKDVGPGRRIEKEHDLHMLEGLLSGEL